MFIPESAYLITQGNDSGPHLPRDANSNFDGYITRESASCLINISKYSMFIKNKQGRLSYKLVVWIIWVWNQVQVEITLLMKENNKTS